jgi:hypothetical protein
MNDVSHRRKTASLFAVSDEPPYGTSLPAAGAVRHINSELMRCNKMIGETQNYRASLVH